MSGTGTSVVAVIPARYGAQRFPAKPLVDLLGKTMVQRVYEQVRKARLVGSVIVATDDERIAASVGEVGGIAVMTDPSLPSGSDRVAAAVEGIEADIIVNVQGDEPLIPPGMIDETVQALLETPEAGAATPARRITDPDVLANPNIVKVVCAQNGAALYFSRSPVPYLRGTGDMREWPVHHSYLKHFGLYAYRRKTLELFVRLEPGILERAEQLEQLRLLENGIRIQISETEYDSVPVDTPEDAERVRSILSGTSI
jgi:3-deoxy-manno-octulosonate cytidylyltransferase (CMP-KDO synthetase)